ncbi:MAG: hypothetical protein JO216_18400 [Hyphomicrobiales bacterium]|nr:hypothetical protein [Hyphomicrobiales bacterium]
MWYDFNVLERRAQELIDSNRPSDAIKIYMFMGDGDQSLDGGYLGMRIGECYEKMGDLHAARYWYGRAVEENPSIECYVNARKHLDHVNVNHLVPPEDYMRRGESGD